MTQAPTNTSAAPAAAPGGRGEPIVVLQRVTKVFKDFWMRSRARAVDNVNLEIYPREVFGLLGPNGSGKSTTIKMILGLLKPTSGRVSVFGKRPDDVLIKRRIGYLPEESYLYGFLNARETLDYYGKLFELDYRTRQQRIDELIDMIGLANAQYRPVREYSKGMQRRIGIAQALINDPDFLILDEPTTGLDPIGTRQIKDLIIELGRRGKTILLSSHLLADVEDCVDRMVILYGGTIRAAGTCDDLLTSRDRMAIETDPLDDDTVAAVDRVIRERSGGDRMIQRVIKPRQRLEDLFLEIVERARAEQVATSGATAGGQTAAFLRADEGEVLIDQLVNAQAPVASPQPDAPAPAPTVARDEAAEVIGNLLSGPAASAAPEPAPAGPSTQPPGRAPAARPAPAPEPEVDASVIDKLLDADRPSGGDRPDRGARP